MQGAAFNFNTEASIRGAELRGRIRSGELTRHTSGLADDLVQGNLVVLPAADAHDFLLYCQRNPRPCPLISVGDVGDPSMPMLGTGIDLRTDLPRYRVWRDGEMVNECEDVSDVWRKDLVAFVIGCSFSFEWAMRIEGIPVRHIEEDRNVPMYRTSIETHAAGAFGGPLVVSMRPLAAADAIRAIREMRYRMEEGAASSNLKRGPGGVVDIEFVVQVMQLVHGGANPALQTPETLAGLVALHAAGHLGDDAFEFFETAYRVLRSIEGRLRLLNATGRQEFPSSREEQQKLAHLLGYERPELLEEDVRQLTGRTREEFEAIFTEVEQQAD